MDNMFDVDKEEKVPILERTFTVKQIATAAIPIVGGIIGCCAIYAKGMKRAYDDFETKIDWKDVGGVKYPDRITFKSLK